MDLRRINELGFEKISIWYTFVLVLSFSFYWNVFIVATSFAVFLLTTSVFSFHLKIMNVEVYLYASDIVYLFEVVFTLSYARNKRLRKLRFSKGKHWIFLIIDIISLIPFELFYIFHYVKDNKNPLYRGILAQNRSLRIYRIFILEWFYMPTIRTPWKYILFTFLLFFAKTVIVGHLLTCVWYNLHNNVTCDKKIFSCYLWYEVNMLNVVILKWSGPEKMFTALGERIVVAIAMLSGFLIIFTYIYPYTFYFSILTGCRDSIVIEKRRRLDKFIGNMIKKTELKHKIRHYFTYTWDEGEEETELQMLLKNTPLAMQKDIFTDIYWEAFRHSSILRYASRNFKRSLSLLMTTEYHYDGEVVYFKGQEKTKMIFLVQGVLQVMAEENEKSPLVSFSSGTVFGELSLFLLTTSQALLKCKGYCELQILSNRKIFSALGDYPKDRKLIFQKYNEKITMAKQTQWRKKRFKEDQKLEMLSMEASYFTIVDCVKWLKMQWRHSWEGHKRHLDVIKAKSEGTRLQSWRMPVRPEIKVEFISNYLDLIVLSNMLEEKKGIVCLKSTFPFSIDPETYFFFIWKYIIFVTSFIPALVYPICTGWYDIFPFPVYLISYVVTLIYIIDLNLKLITAVRTKHATITVFKDVLRHNMKKITFYLDIIAAVPYQIYILYRWDVTKEKAYKIGLVLHPAIAKSYVFFLLKAPLGPSMSQITMLKNCFILLLFLYWLSDIIQLLNVLNAFSNSDDGWIQRVVHYFHNPSFLRRYVVAFIKATVTAIGFASNKIYSDESLDMVLTCLGRYLFFVFSCYFMGTYYSSIVVKRFGLETFRILMGRLKNYLASKNVAEKIVERTIRSIEFQWKYDKASYIMSEVSVLKALPYNIRREVFLETTYKTLASSPLFQGESPEYVMEVLENSDYIAVPQGLVLVTYGHTSHILIILNRGFCQLNSHLESDVTSNVGRAVTVGPGCTFPLLSSFCNVPAPISVVTVTDCELIVVDLNKLISTMIKHKIFKDVVDVMQELKLSVKLLASKPALMKIDAPDSSDDESNSEQKIRGRLKKLLYTCWKRFAAMVHTTLLKYWGYLYMIYLLLDCWFWPSCFGVFLFQSYFLIPLLTVGKIVILIHMLIQTLFPYYNEMGLLVDHPLHTLLHYLSTTFVLDVLRFVPIFPIYYYGFANPYEKPNMYLLLVGAMQCLIGLTHIVGCIGYIGSFFNDSYYTARIKFLVSFLIVLNLHVNFCMCGFSTWTFGGPYRVIGFDVKKDNKPAVDIIRENNVWDYYLYISYWVMSTLTLTQYKLNEATGIQLYFSYFHAIIGTIIGSYVYVMISSSSKFTHTGGASFREEFSSLMKYLNHEKLDEKTIERVKLYCKYLWSKTGGENIKEIFGQLPLYLLEELWYPLYRPTFVKNSLFEEADEGFFRILSTHVSSVFYTRGSLIIFKNESQSYIYFLHRGKCFVYDWFMVLDIGSIIGDVHQTGVMLNKVYALTHVEMLKISSETFFTIISNFDSLEANFVHKMKRAESFVKSDVYRDHQPLRPVDSRDAINAFELGKKEIGFEDESHFEDPENITPEAFSEIKYKSKQKRTYIIYPHSWYMKVYTYVALVDVILTVLSIPSFLMFGGLSVPAFIFIGVLDFVWLIYLITNFFVGLLDEEKGDVITNHKFIAKRYLHSSFALDLISLIPFELIPVIIAESFEKADTNAVLCLRVFRYCRAISFFWSRELDFGMMKNEFAKKCLLIIIVFFWFMITMTATFVRITENPYVVSAKDDFHFRKEQFGALLEVLVYVINCFTATDVPSILPVTRMELVHFNCCIFIIIYLKGRVISNILSLIYFRNLSTFIYKARVTKLETYLKKKEASPIIVQSVVGYQTNLFRFSSSENMPSLLMRVPITIRIPLMKDLVGQQVINFPLFEGLDSIFLDQLVARTKREVYFPGQKIVEQGDVDHRLYLIQRGEVYVINQTKERAYVEYVVGRMYGGEYFGEAQGFWYAKAHPYTYRGRTLVEIMVLHWNDWMDLRRDFPDTALKIFEKAKTLRFI